MVPKPRNISFEQAVNAPPADVYRAFTNSTLLRAWLCDAAQADPRLKGRLYLWWKSGYYMCGEYTHLSPNQAIVFTWHGRDDPGDTEVTVNLVEKDGTTLVKLKQAKVKSRGSWIRFRHEVQRGWMTGLENLASVLETGRDIRIIQRPMLGANLSDYGSEWAAQLGIPVSEGIRLDDVIPGMGATQAGLQKNDVIVSVSGRPTSDVSELFNILRGKRAGDKIEVVYYRGSKINIATIQLSTRPLPAIPETIEALLQIVRTSYETRYDELASCFDGISEVEASHHPADGEWSAKEVLAHLIHCERDLQAWIADLVNNQERVSDGFSDNVPARIAATVTAYPLISDLLSEFKNHQIETLNILANLPGEFQACKGNYWRMGITVLQGISHIRAHKDQLQAALKAARNQA
jgi:uncharacterized protein YndB with AHSA1/START domain